MSERNQHSDVFRIEYLSLSIIPTGSTPKRLTPSMSLAGFIVLGATLLFVFGLDPLR
jgi:hypothetical protein